MPYLFRDVGGQGLTGTNIAFSEVVVPSFDMVSEVDVQEVRNAIDQCVRELRTRFDFKNVDSGFDFDQSSVLVWAEEEFQLKQLEEILFSKLTGRKIDVRALLPQTVEASGRQKRQRYSLQSGIDRDTAKKIVAMVKSSKLKVQTQIQGEKLRLTGKKKDDLQEVMGMVREADLSVPVQFNNYRD